MPVSFFSSFPEAMMKRAPDQKIYGDNRVDPKGLISFLMPLTSNDGVFSIHKIILILNDRIGSGR